MNATSLNTQNRTSFDCWNSQTFDYYHIPDNLPDSVEPTWAIFAAINGIVFPPTIVINFLIIWTILSDNSLKTVTHNIVLAALAVTDFLEGLVVEPLYISYLVALITRSPMPCHFTVYSVPSLTLSCLTLNTLMVASVDLYLAIDHPQYYLQHVTTKKVLIAAAVCGFVTLFFIFAGSLLKMDSLLKLPNAVAIVLNLVVIVYCTIRIQITAYRQRQSIQAQEQAVQQENTQQNNRERRAYKRIMAMSTMILATFLFYCPYVISAIIQAVKGKDATDDFKYISHPISVTFVHLQSLVNPIVVSLRLSYIYQPVKNMILCRTNQVDT